jgi:glycosyltransferase involved in cell wall biosynthesis
MPANQIQRVLLLANYINDRQESMQRFADLLAAELPKRNVAVEVVRPEEKFGRLKRSGHGLGKWLGYIDKFVLFPRQLGKRLARLGPGEVLHIADHSNAVYTREAAAVPHLVTCHDLLAIRSALGEIPENRTSSLGRAYQRMILNGLKGSARVTCVSQSTRADLLRLTQLRDDHVSVTYNGLNYPYRPVPREEAASLLTRLPQLAGRSGKFILHVGGNQWYKNRAGVVRIYEELTKVFPDAPDLYLVGKSWPESLRRQIAAAGLEGRVVEIDGCSNEDLRALYSSCELFLFPSLMEGFGWPIIEAQACGAVVATSKIAPMTEVGGDAAIYIDPRDAEKCAMRLAEELRSNSADKTRRAEAGIANAARFSTERMIDGYIREYEIVLAATPRN